MTGGGGHGGGCGGGGGGGGCGGGGGGGGGGGFGGFVATNPVVVPGGRRGEAKPSGRGILVVAVLMVIFGVVVLVFIIPILRNRSGTIEYNNAPP